MAAGWGGTKTPFQPGHVIRNRIFSQIALGRSSDLNARVRCLCLSLSELNSVSIRSPLNLWPVRQQRFVDECLFVVRRPCRIVNLKLVLIKSQTLGFDFQRHVNAPLSVEALVSDSLSTAGFSLFVVCRRRWRRRGGGGGGRGGGEVSRSYYCLIYLHTWWRSWNKAREYRRH